MKADSYTQFENLQPIPSPSDWQQLAQENRALRAMITELLIKNQNLRWELLADGCGSARLPEETM